MRHKDLEDVFNFAAKPRSLDKKKRHGRGFTEDIQEKRAQRVNFKKYMQQIEEQELLDTEDESE
jgi:hypothetical protein